MVKIVNNPGKTIYCKYCGGTDYLSWKFKLKKIGWFFKHGTLECLHLQCGHSWKQNHRILLYMKDWFKGKKKYLKMKENKK